MTTPKPASERNYLEEISEKIRKGEPVGYLQAIAAINYQGQLRDARDAERQKRWWFRALRFLRGVSP